MKLNQRRQISKEEFWTNLPEDEKVIEKVDEIIWSKNDFARYDFELSELLPWISSPAFEYLVYKYTESNSAGSLFFDAFSQSFVHGKEKNIHERWNGFTERELQEIGNWIRIVLDKDNQVT